MKAAYFTCSQLWFGIATIAEPGTWKSPTCIGLGLMCFAAWAVIEWRENRG